MKTIYHLAKYNVWMKKISRSNVRCGENHQGDYCEEPCIKEEEQ